MLIALAIVAALIVLVSIELWRHFRNVRNISKIRGWPRRDHHHSMDRARVKGLISDARDPHRLHQFAHAMLRTDETYKFWIGTQLLVVAQNKADIKTILNCVNRPFFYQYLPEFTTGHIVTAGGELEFVVTFAAVLKHSLSYRYCFVDRW